MTRLSDNQIVSPLKGGLMMISKMVEKLPPSEAKLAKYILENPVEAINLTASDLGNKSHTSGAAVIRLCKSLGLKGLPELKLRVAGDLQQTVEESYRDIQPGETKESVLYKMTSNSLQAIRETSEILNMDDLGTAVDLLLKADNIHFFGVGASSIIAQDAIQKFIRINKNATAWTDLHILGTVIGNVTNTDVVVGISNSGETEEVVRVVELAKQKGATTLGLTSFGQSSLSKAADITLFTTTSNEAPFRSGATSSRLAQLYVIDVLFMCLATQQYDESIAYIDQSRDAVKQLRRK